MVKPHISYNSLSHIIAGNITEQIMMGYLKPGEKIVETAYADEYGTSRAPIREALYLLTIEGLVERIPRKGAVVKGYTDSEIHDLLEMRMMLENMALKRIASSGIEPSILQEMESLIPLMEQNEQDKSRYAQLNQTFHLNLVQMAGSNIITNMYSRLGLPLLTLQTMSFVGERNILKSMEEHRLIVSLLKKEDFEEVQKVLEKHNLDVIHRVEQTLNQRENTE